MVSAIRWYQCVRGADEVAGAVGRGPADVTVRAELGAWRPGVKHLADPDPAGGELVACSLDVGDYQIEALGRAGRLLETAAGEQSLTCRSVHKQQEAETDGGEQA